MSSGSLLKRKNTDFLSHIAQLFNVGRNTAEISHVDSAADTRKSQSSRRAGEGSSDKVCLCHNVGLTQSIAGHSGQSLPFLIKSKPHCTDPGDVNSKHCFISLIPRAYFVNNPKKLEAKFPKAQECPRGNS